MLLACIDRGIQHRSPIFTGKGKPGALSDALDKLQRRSQSVMTPYAAAATKA